MGVHLKHNSQNRWPVRFGQCNPVAVVPGSAASLLVSPGSLLEMPILGSHPRPTEPETLGVKGRQSVRATGLGDFEKMKIPYSLTSTSKNSCAISYAYLGVLQCFLNDLGILIEKV